MNMFTSFQADIITMLFVSLKSITNKENVYAICILSYDNLLLYDHYCTIMIIQRPELSKSKKS